MPVETAPQKPHVPAGEGDVPQIEIPPLDPAAQAAIEQHFDQWPAEEVVSTAENPLDLPDYKSELESTTEPIEAGDQKEVSNGFDLKAMPELPDYKAELEAAGKRQVAQYNDRQQEERKAAFVGEDEQAKKDYEAYLKSRSFQDEKGRIRSADGKFSSTDREQGIIDRRLEQESGELYFGDEDYDSMSTSEIARHIGVLQAGADNEKDGNKTRLAVANEVLELRIKTMAEKRSLSDEELELVRAGAQEMIARGQKEFSAQNARRKANDEALKASQEQRDEALPAEQAEQDKRKSMQTVAQELGRAFVEDDKDEIARLSELLEKKVHDYAKAGSDSNSDTTFEQELEKAMVAARNLQRKEISRITGKELELEEMPSVEAEKTFKEMNWREKIAYLKARATTALFEGGNKLAEMDPKRRNVAIGVGVVALGAVGAYVASRLGVSIGGGGHQEKLHTVQSVDLDMGTVAAKVNDKAQRAQEMHDTAHAFVAFDVKPGEGFTQVMSHMPEAKGLSPEQIHWVYQQAHLQDLIDHSNTYILPNGELGIRDATKDILLDKDGIRKLLESAQKR